MIYCGECIHFDTAKCYTCNLSNNSAPSNFEAHKPKPDNVNHPSHYAGKFECIDVMIETQGVEAVKAFCLCNAFKYLYRHNRKENEVSIDKALWYLNKYVELRDNQNANNEAVQ